MPLIAIIIKYFKSSPPPKKKIWKKSAIKPSLPGDLFFFKSLNTRTSPFVICSSKIFATLSSKHCTMRNRSHCACRYHLIHDQIFYLNFHRISRNSIYNFWLIIYDFASCVNYLYNCFLIKVYGFNMTKVISWVFPHANSTHFAIEKNSHIIFFKPFQVLFFIFYKGTIIILLSCSISLIS